MEITNGHAARMRFARFKNQMEGTVPKTRAPRDKSRAPKPKRVKTKDEKKEEDGGEKALLKLKLEEGAAPGSTAPAGEPEAKAPVRSPVVKPEPADEVVLGDADAPGEVVDEREQHNTHVMITPSHSPPHSTNPTPSHVLSTPAHHQESPYHHISPHQRRPSIEFSPASSFAFSPHDMMSSQSSMVMQSMDGSGTQDMGMAPMTSFYDPFLFGPPQPHQQQHQQQMLVDGQGRVVKGGLQWDASFC